MLPYERYRMFRSHLFIRNRPDNPGDIAYANWALRGLLNSMGGMAGIW